jgi:RHS repeat-associated protein
MADEAPTENPQYSAYGQVFITDVNGQLIPKPNTYVGENQINTDDPIDFWEYLPKNLRPIRLGVIKDLTPRATQRSLDNANRKKQQQQPQAPPVPPPPPETLPDLPPAEHATVTDEISNAPATLGGPAAPADVQIRFTPGTRINPEQPQIEDYDVAQIFGPLELPSRISPPPPPSDLDDFMRRVRRNQPRRGEKDPTHADPPPSKPVTGGDPVELASGVFVISNTDLQVPSPYLPIQFTRSYRSGRPYDGPFGFSWDHNFNVYVRVLNDGSLALWTGALRELYFKPSGTGWNGADGVLAEVVSPSPDEYEVRWRQGFKWHLSKPAGWSHPERIPLRRMADRLGHALTLTYDGEDRPLRVADEHGRGFTFSYGKCGLLERVSDHTGTRHVQYHHHDHVEVLRRVIQPPTDASPGGVVTEYEYDLESPHPAMRFNIISISDTRGARWLENTYAGPERSWEFNRVVEQRVGDDFYTFLYEHIQFVPSDAAFVDIPATRTNVQMPDGALHSYVFNYRGDILDHRTRLVRDGSYQVVVQQARYDELGQLVLRIRGDGSKTAYHYDSQNLRHLARGNLLRVEEIAAKPYLTPSRTVAQVGYDTAFQLPVSITDENGGKTLLSYDFTVGQINAVGKLLEVHLPSVAPQGAPPEPGEKYTYNAAGQTETVVSPSGVKTTYEYFTSGPHTGFVSRIIRGSGQDAHEVQFAYDARGFPARVDDGPGHATDLQANAYGWITHVLQPEIDGARATVRQHFGDVGQVVRREHPLGAEGNRWTADPFVADAFDYDLLGRQLGERLATNTTEERQWKFSVDHEGRIVSRWDPSGRRDTICRDERGLVLREVQAAGTSDAYEVRYVYDRRGALVARIEPDGSRTRYDYDLWGRPRWVRRPNRSGVLFGWGAGDRLLEYAVYDDEQPSGTYATLLYRERRTYDARGRLIKQTVDSFAPGATPAPLVTTFGYDLDSRPTSVTNPYGVQSTIEYDGAGRLAASVDPYGNRRTVAYDKYGNVKEQSILRAGAPTPIVLSALEYDARDRLVAVVRPQRELRWVWDPADRVIEERSGTVSRWTATYNVHEELVGRTVDAAQLNMRREWSRDSLGRIQLLKDATGATTEYGYDPHGTIERIVLPDGSIWRFAANRRQRTLERVAPSGAKTFARLDAVSGLPLELSTVAAAGQLPVATRTFQYDGLGRIVGATSGGQSITREYDSLGRILKETAQGQTTEVAHDDVTRVTTISYPDGTKEQVTFDATGRPQQITDVSAFPSPQIDFGYDLPGRRSAVAHGNTCTIDHHYDDVDRVVTVDAQSGGTTVDGVGVGFDAWGHRGVEQRAVGGGGTQVHGFDLAGRLVQSARSVPVPQLPSTSSVAARAAAVTAARVMAATSGSRDDYTLDAADTRISLQRITPTQSASTTYASNATHQVTAVNGLPVTYDADGNRIEDSRFTYVFDALNRLREVRDRTSGALLHQLEYDALSRRAHGSATGHTYKRWFLGQNCISQETTGPSPRGIRYTLDPLTGTPLRVVINGSAFALVQDDRLSTIATVAFTGGLAERRSFDPFGAATATAGGGAVTPDADSTWWGGMQPLAGTPLYHADHRTYDAQLGVFLSPDPLWYLDSSSRYAFAGHNPVDYLDPTGLGQQTKNGDDKRSPVGEWLHQQSIFTWNVNLDFVPQMQAVDTGNTALNFLCNSVGSVVNWLYAKSAPGFAIMHVLGNVDEHLRANGMNPDALHGVFPPLELPLALEYGLLRFNAMVRAQKSLRVVRALQRAKKVDPVIGSGKAYTGIFTADLKTVPPDVIVESAGQSERDIRTLHKIWANTQLRQFLDENPAIRKALYTEYPQLEGPLAGYESLKGPLNPYGIPADFPKDLGLLWHHVPVLPGDSPQQLGLLHLTPTAQHHGGGVFNALYHLQFYNGPRAGRWYGGYQQWGEVMGLMYGPGGVDPNRVTRWPAYVNSANP